MPYEIALGGTGSVTAAGARIKLGIGPDSSPTFTNLTLTGNLSVAGVSTLTGNTTIGGTLGVTGLSTLNSLAVTGNMTVGGILGVTGVSTLSDDIIFTHSVGRIAKTDTTGSVHVTAGTTFSDGAALVLRGGTHATEAHDIRFFANNISRYYWDESAVLHTFTGPVTTTGSLVTNGSLTTNGNIVFPAVQVPSANANTLDDYEEGDWTPTVTFSTPGNVAVTYSTQSGKYTKIGRQVTLVYTVITSTFTHTTASGTLLLTGAPVFTVDHSGRGAADLGGITLSGGGTYAVSANSGSNLQFIQVAPAGGRLALTAGNTTTGTNIVLVGTHTYFST